MSLLLQDFFQKQGRDSKLITYIQSLLGILNKKNKKNKTIQGRISSLINEITGPGGFSPITQDSISHRIIPLYNEIKKEIENIEIKNKKGHIYHELSDYKHELGTSFSKFLVIPLLRQQNTLLSSFLMNSPLAEIVKHDNAKYVMDEIIKIEKDDEKFECAKQFFEQIVGPSEDDEWKEGVMDAIITSRSLLNFNIDKIKILFEKATLNEDEKEGEESSSYITFLNKISDIEKKIQKGDYAMGILLIKALTKQGC